MKYLFEKYLAKFDTQQGVNYYYGVNNAYKICVVTAIFYTMDCMEIIIILKNT